MENENIQDKIDSERLPDNISGIAVLIPIDDRDVFPEEFEEEGKTFKRIEKPEWDFQHKSYKVYKKVKLQVGDTFEYLHKIITIKGFTTLKDDFGKNVEYIIYSDGTSKMFILPETIFYTCFDTPISEKFIQKPSIEFDKKRIEVSLEESNPYPYPIDFVTDGIITKITCANPSVSYTLDFKDLSNIPEGVEPSINLLVMEDKLFFMPLKAGYNVLTFQVMDKTKTKSVLEPIIIKINSNTKFKEETEDEEDKGIEDERE